MTQLRNKVSGALVEVSEGLAERLLALGTYEVPEAPKPARRASTRTAAKTEPTED